MIRSANPALSDNTFSRYANVGQAEQMTVQGVVAKTAIALLCVLISAGYTWMKFFQSGGQASSISILMWVGILGGLVLAIATVIKKEMGAGDDCILCAV